MALRRARRRDALASELPRARTVGCESDNQSIDQAQNDCQTNPSRHILCPWNDQQRQHHKHCCTSTASKREGQVLRLHSEWVLAAATDCAPSQSGEASERNAKEGCDGYCPNQVQRRPTQPAPPARIVDHIRLPVRAPAPSATKQPESAAPMKSDGPCPLSLPADRSVTVSVSSATLLAVSGAVGSICAAGVTRGE